MTTISKTTGTRQAGMDRLQGSGRTSRTGWVKLLLDEIEREAKAP